MDVLGLSHAEYSDAEREAVVHAHPRTAHFKEDIIRAFYDGIKHKPETTFGNVKADVLADKDPHFTRGKAFGSPGSATPPISEVSVRRTGLPRWRWCPRCRLVTADHRVPRENAVAEASSASDRLTPTDSGRSVRFHKIKLDDARLASHGNNDAR
jgi:hypothetical protein